MMNYELFREVVAEKFLEFMPDNFQECRVEVYSINKVNQTLDQLHIKPFAPTEQYAVSPIIYVNEMYEDYRKTGDLQKTLEHAAFFLTGKYKMAEKLSQTLQLEDTKTSILMELVNTEQNREMLETVPHREFQDLSIIYRYLVEESMDGLATAIVTNLLAEQIHMDEEALYTAAMDNTRHLFPPVVKSMNDLIKEMFGLPDEIADQMLGEMPPELEMYVITNDRGIHGAVSMLYEDKLHELAENLGTDLYIMPSSIHEVIAVSAKMVEPNELAQMVEEVNMNQVAISERLSNQVYHYDKNLRKLMLASDTPNKRLDGIVAGPGPIYEQPERTR